MTQINVRFFINLALIGIISINNTFSQLSYYPQGDSLVPDNYKIQTTTEIDFERQLRGILEKGENLNFIAENLAYAEKSFSRSSWVYELKGSYFILDQKYLLALKSLDKAISLDSYNKNAWKLKGQCLIRTKNYHKGVRHYDHMIKEGWVDYETYLYHGHCKFMLKKYKRALIDLNRSIELNPNEMSAYGYRAQSRMHLKEYDAALDDCNYVLENYPQALWIYLTMGDIYRLRDDDERACYYYHFLKAYDLEAGEKRIAMFCY